MTTTERLEALKALVNQLRPPGRVLTELRLKRKCRDLYGREPKQRTWDRWKTLTLVRGWTYADTVCLRFIAMRLAGNQGQGRMRSYSCDSLIQDINSAIQGEGIEAALAPPSRPSNDMTGLELEEYLKPWLGDCTARQWRNRGVYRRRLYSPAQIDQIIQQAP